MTSGRSRKGRERGRQGRKQRISQSIPTDSQTFCPKPLLLHYGKNTPYRSRHRHPRQAQAVQVPECGRSGRAGGGRNSPSLARWSISRYPPGSIACLREEHSKGRNMAHSNPSVRAPFCFYNRVFQCITSSATWQGEKRSGASQRGHLRSSCDRSHCFVCSDARTAMKPKSADFAHTRRDSLDHT